MGIREARKGHITESWVLVKQHRSQKMFIRSISTPVTTFSCLLMGSIACHPFSLLGTGSRKKGCPSLAGHVTV